ncbi:MAG: hypothetical protein WAL95_22250 [Candidatus Acidiferrales bacterium]
MKQSGAYTSGRRIVALMLTAMATCGVVLFLVASASHRRAAQVNVSSTQQASPRVNSAIDNEDGIASNLANLESVDQLFRRDYEEVSDTSTRAEFQRYREELGELLADSKRLHDYARERYKASLATDRDKAIIYATADIQTEASLGQIALVLKQAQNPSNVTMADNTIQWQNRLETEQAKWSTIVVAYSSDSDSVSRYAEDPRDLAELLRKGSLKLLKSRSQLAQGDVLGGWITVVDADLLIESTTWRLLGYYTDVFNRGAVKP